MVPTLTCRGRKLAGKLLLIQVCVVIATAVLMALAIDVDWGISALIGGGIFVIANATFSYCAFLFSGARAAKHVVMSFYGGEVAKILLTVILFSIVYLYAEVKPFPLTLTYLLALGSNLFAPVLFIHNNK